MCFSQWLQDVLHSMSLCVRRILDRLVNDIECLRHVLGGHTGTLQCSVT